MSGGSFEYLFLKDWRQLAQSIEHLEEMADLLDEEGSTRAARDTRKILDRLKAEEDIPESLRRVWHHVEWWKSCDYSREQAMAEVAKYDSAPEAPAHEWRGLHNPERHAVWADGQVYCFPAYDGCDDWCSPDDLCNCCLVEELAVQTSANAQLGERVFQAGNRLANIRAALDAADLPLGES